MLVFALDIGSSSVRAAVFDGRGRRAGRVSARFYALSYGRHGVAELDPRAVRVAVRGLAAQFRARLRAADVVASCAFWHGLLGLDEKLRPITPIYTWADSRCRDDAAILRQELSERRILQRTGCMLRFTFWPAKLRWLRRTEPALFRRVRVWVSPSDWILRDLFGELATSQSMASATGLFDQGRRAWDSEMCAAAGIDTAQLPRISEWLQEGKVLTAIGDGAAGNLGSGATSERTAAVNLGTSAAVRVMTSHFARIPFGLFRYIANPNTFVLGGAVSNAGNLRGWCRRHLRIRDSVQLDRAAAACDKMMALPFLAAERAPDWPEIDGMILGLEFATTPAEILRALTTSALYRLADIFDSLEQAVGRIDRIIVSGGMTKSRDMLAIFADALGRDIEVASETEASLRGAALHGLWQRGISVDERKSGRVLRFNKACARRHRERREEQRRLVKMFSRSRAGTTPAASSMPGR